MSAKYWVSRPWTTGELDELWALRADHYSIAECAVKMGRSLGSVKGALHRMGLSRPSGKQRRKPGELAAAVAAMVPSYGVTRTAVRLKVTRQAVYRTLAAIRAKHDNSARSDAARRYPKRSG